jgi:hypothetical protein
LSSPASKAPRKRGRPRGKISGDGGGDRDVNGYDVVSSQCKQRRVYKKAKMDGGGDSVTKKPKEKKKKKQQEREGFVQRRPGYRTWPSSAFAYPEAQVPVPRTQCKE